ncbi:MAG: hypothetical protein R2880_08245 [Deinococcales bacterium]
MPELLNYRYRGARALVLLHEQQMRQCLQVWHKAKAAQVILPETDDSDYESLEHLLRHILGAARGYMLWMCKHLQLSDPEIQPPPSLEEIEQAADGYLAHLLERWRLPLAQLEAKRFGEEYLSNWGMSYSIDAMLEHAVMHPIRHKFQLEELLKAQK